MHVINSDSDLGCNMDKKDEILDKLGKMNVDQLDKLRDKKQLEMREILKKYYKAKDEELTCKHEKRKELMKNNSLSKVEQLLRADEELYLHKKLILSLTDVKKQLEIELELVKDFFWKARA